MPANAHPNRTALVTGAGRARGIGAATAIRLGCNGLAVAVADLVPPGGGGRQVLDGLEETVRRIEEAGGQAIVVPLDVTDPGQIDAAISSTVVAFGGLDVLVNNAGTSAGVGPFTELSDEKWQPHEQAIRRLKAGATDDPDKRAMTWRAFQCKLHIETTAG